MSVDMSLVKKLREQTGVSILECKKAVDESNNDFDKAEELLRKKGFEKAKAKSSREANQGAIGSYIHTNFSIGVMLELGCETDFVAKTDDFNEFAKNIAMHIAATNPVGIVPEDVPQAIIDREREIYKAQVLEMGKPEQMVEKIAEGKMNKFFAENCLMSQLFVKDDSKSVAAVVSEAAKQAGGEATIKDFVRFEVG